MNSKVTYKKDRIECEVDKELSLLEALKNEQTQLLQKLEKIRIEDNYGTYKNIVTALSEVTRLIEKNTPIEKWEEKVSHYKSRTQDYNGEYTEMISIWKQKGEDIKDVRKYKVTEEIPFVKVTIDEENIVDTVNETKIPMVIGDNDIHYIILQKKNGKYVRFVLNEK